MTPPKENFPIPKPKELQIYEFSDEFKMTVLSNLIKLKNNTAREEN